MKYKPLTKEQLSKIIYDATYPLGLYSKAVLNLLLATCAQESHFGTYRRQIHGPAVGIFQIEPATFNWLKGKYREKYPVVEQYQIDDLEFDDQASAMFARLRYYAYYQPLPNADDLEGLWKYYKRVYNTFKGAATKEEFMRNWERFVTGTIK